MQQKHSIHEDKNFDDLAHHYKRNIYARLKGRIRLAILRRDLQPYLSKPLRIVDAGGGQGQFALELTKQGHNVSLCDISREMLRLAKENAAHHRLDDKITLLHCPLQELAQQLSAPVDLAMCHAVLEWLATPEAALAHLSECVQPEGLLSLAFFNKNSIIYKNLLRANYYKVQSGDFTGQSGSLTPLHPLEIEDVFRWCKTAGFEILDYSGIRVFHDYIAEPMARARAPDDALALEMAFSKKEPYRSLGRYIHVVARKRQ